MWLLCVLCIVIGGQGNRHLGCVPSGLRGYRRAQAVTMQGGGALSPTQKIDNAMSSFLPFVSLCDILVAGKCLCMFFPAQDSVPNILSWGVLVAGRWIGHLHSSFPSQVGQLRVMGRRLVSKRNGCCGGSLLSYRIGTLLTFFWGWTSATSPWWEPCVPNPWTIAPSNELLPSFLLF